MVTVSAAAIRADRHLKSLHVRRVPRPAATMTAPYWLILDALRQFLCGHFTLLGQNGSPPSFGILLLTLNFNKYPIRP